MMRHALLALAFSLIPAVAPADGEPRPLSVLFLGDSGHHRPADRAAQLIPVLASRGIAVTYTNRLDDLNPENLARYDALLVYANIDEIGPGQEKALLDYVSGGGGFVPIHCASYCFRNSPACVALIGAQFLRHGTGEFDTKVVEPGHPTMAGLEPFRTWDETYVHSKHNTEGRTVLQVRAEGDGEEPWTWVRSQGRGRVFYTAYGHDERTWGHPGFHDLIERGIRWASAKGDVFDSRPRVKTGLPPFEYIKAPAKVPFYPAGKSWGTQGKAEERMQKPLEAAESQKHMAVPRGFEVKLFATEPEIAKPIAMAWDHRGRLWIAETFDYPNEMQPKGQGHDRIKICEDTDGDGRADKFTVFAEALSIPTSLTFGNGGVIVHQAPETLFLKDTDGDGRADVRQTLFRGWGTGDTHAGPSNLRYGLDNWIWGIVGYSGFKGEVVGERLEFRQGIYRFKPDGSKLEFLRSTNNNSWGLGFSEEGLVFGSTANGCPSVYLPIPNRYYEAVRGWSAGVLGNIADSNRFFPITANVRQVDWHGGFTAAAGHALYTARTYPQVYWNNTAFVTEPTGHLVATFALEAKGSDYASHNEWNLLASDDEWCAPVQAEVGPDGNVWVIDWYNYIVQHNPTPQGFENGKGNAYQTPLRDKTHGRIYRVVAQGGRPSPTLSLDPADGPRLVDALKSDNMLWRTTAQRLLVERGKRDVVPALTLLASDGAVDAVGLNPGAIHALRTLQGLGALDEAGASVAISAFKHASPGVRRNALEAAPRDAKTAAAILDARLLSDPDARVRLSAFLALSEVPRSGLVANALASALAEGAAEGDRWLGDALTSAASAHDLEFLKALAGREFPKAPAASTVAVVGRVAEHYARGGPADSVGSLLLALGGADPRLGDAIVVALAKGWPKAGKLTLADAEEKAVLRLLDRVSPAAKGPLVTLVMRWGSRGFERTIAEIAGSLLAGARDETRTDAERTASARQLLEFRAADADAAREVIGLLASKASPDLVTGLLQAVATSESPAVGPALVDRLAVMTPSARTQATRVLLGRADWTSAFIDGVEAGKIRLDDLSLDQKQSLVAHPDKALAARAKTLLGRGGGLPDPDRQKVIDALAPAVLRPGDVARGKVVFQQQCAKCHKHGAEGNTIGPDLTGMAAHPKAELLTHILDPSRSVEGNYTQYAVVTGDGRIFNGLLASETKNAVELVDTEGKRHQVLREDIEELAASKKSLMPEGFEKQVPPESIADLLEFLTHHGRYLPLDLRKAATSVSTQGMFISRDSEPERLVFEDWSPKTFEGVPFRLVDPQGTRLPNVIMLHGPLGTFPPRMPRSVSLDCNTPARAIHMLSGVSGWGSPGGAVPPTVSMIVRLHYADGTVEDHPLKNGVHFADYIRRVDVPGSALAFMLGSQQIRYLAVVPNRGERIERIELVKGPDHTAPVVMAVTVETPE